MLHAFAPALFLAACGVEVLEPGAAGESDETVRSTQPLSANDCPEGRGCAKPPRTYSVNAQDPKTLGSADYCKNRKCGRGEGDCDSDSECQSGMRCVTDRGGFIGKSTTVDICWPIERICYDLGPCVHGEGDCDTGPGIQGPRQCAENTVCKNLSGETDECRTRNPEDLGPTLAKFTVNAPGFAAAVFDDEGTVAIGFRGVRKAGESAALRRSDRFHLGSNTKAMTATLAAVLEDAGEISWNEEDKADGLLPLVKHSGYSSVYDELQDLLDHRTGMPANAKVDLSGNLMAQRYLLSSLYSWRLAPVATPGDYSYSNLGYQVAAHIMESKTGEPYEDMMVRRLFKPLGMDSCSFDPSPTVWGHTKQEVTRPDGVKVYSWIPSQADNPPLHNSSGRVTCNLDDWGKFLREHIRGRHDISALLPGTSYAHMRRSPGTGYRTGWVLQKYKDYDALWHNGSNRLNYSEAIVVPSLRIAVVVVANSAVTDFFGNVSLQTNAILKSLLSKYAP